ncbi:MAG: Smr/MutS family protein [Pseudomonadota bacterium]
MGGKRRGLTPDERRLWDRVAASTEPLGTSPRPDLPTPVVQPTPETLRSNGANGAKSSGPPALKPAISHALPVRPTPQRRRDSEAHIRVEYTRHEARPVGKPEAGLDRRTADRLRKGNREPDARIDLHGMTAERAHRTALAFVSDSLARGLRMVLVITGKGSGSDPWTGQGRGIIRGALPGWLSASPMASSIVGIYQAHQRHGGAGAVYIYLKRRR